MNRLISICLFTLSTFGSVAGQGLIVNELSQGPSGSKEFIELLVVGSNSQKTGTIDISNWIIDDNNGDFKLADNSSPGIATGHFRFVSNDTTQNMPIGSIIVLYNAADKDPNWTFIKTDINGVDSAYIDNTGSSIAYYIPGTSTLLRAVSSVPNSSSASYAYTNSTIPPSGQNWNGELGLANNGDAIQIRKPDGTFYHGFGFSTPTQTNSFTSFPTFSDVGLPSFNAYKGISNNRDVYFTCGSWYFVTAYLNGTVASVETPGLPNNADNASQIDRIKAGTFDYSLLNNDITCSEALPISINSISTKTSLDGVTIYWSTASEKNIDYFAVEHSTDQQNWEQADIQKSKGDDANDYNYTDPSPLEGVAYYRIREVRLDGKQELSPVVSVAVHSSIADKQVYVFPNPAHDYFTIKIFNDKVKRISISDAAGRTVYTDDKVHQNESLRISTNSWAGGIYYIKLQKEKLTQQMKVMIH